MSLRTLDLPLLLKPSDHDLFRDFFVPALTHAFRHDRSVGYFASGWLRWAWCFAVAAVCYNPWDGVWHGRGRSGERSKETGEPLDDVIRGYRGRVSREAVMEAIRVVTDGYLLSLPALEPA